MYSPEIIERRIRSVEQAYRVRLHRYDVDESIAITKHIESTAYNERGIQIRPLLKSEQDFIWNEVTISRNDFPYWAERFCKIVVDDAEGSRKNIKLTSAQKIFLAKMARTEERMWMERDLGHQRFDGQCYFVHKARQMGLSTHCEIVGVHYVNFWSDTAGLIGSTNDQMTQKLYTDYHLSVYTSMPQWMRAATTSKVKDRGLEFVHNSRVVLQDASQKAGFGQGSKWFWCHLTEVASWADPVSMVENHFFPSISRSFRSMAFLESTSQGMDDWWHTRTESARKGDFGRWQYMFIPWYLVPEFYHGYPPVDWLMPKHAQEEAELIEQTSPEWNNGFPVRPTREMMFWWVQTRKTYEDSNTLNEFYKNYPSVPEQSFTHTGQSSFEHDVIEVLQRQVQQPTYYMLGTRDLPSELIVPDSIHGPKVLPVPGTTYDLVPIALPESMRNDVRGLIMLWELPSERHDYFGGADPAGGIANWSRFMRRKGDTDRDNATIQIIRRGFYSGPDVQVCEFAAPIFPQDFALYINLLGRLFAGRDDNHQCHFTIEVNNTGSACQGELMNRYEYINLYQRYNAKDGINIGYLDQFGWLTNLQTITELWTMGKKWISDGNFHARSQWLVREMRYCRDDDARFKVIRTMVRGKATGKDKLEGKRHDDRVYALLFALEGAHGFSQHMNLMPPQPALRPILVQDSPRKLSVLERDMTYAEYSEYIDSWADALGEI